MTHRVFLKSALHLAWSVTSSTGLAQDTVWTRTFDTGRYDFLCDGVRDRFGDLILVGYSSELPGSPGAMALAVKYAPNGDTIWARTFDTGLDDVIEDVATDAEGNIVAAGWFSGILSGSEVLKYARDGELLWSRLDTADDSRSFFGVDVDDSMNIIAAGDVWRWIDRDALLMKLSPQGESLWATALHFGGDADLFEDVKLARTGDIIAAGRAGFRRWGDFLTAKFNAAGETLWTSRLDFSPSDYASAIAVDPFDNIIVVGSAGDTWPLPRVGVAVKYAPTGDSLWSRTYPLAYRTILSGVALNQAGYVLMTGWTGDTSSGQLNSSAFVMMCDSLGDVIWTWRYNPAEYTFFYELALDDSGFVYAFGEQGDTADFNLLLLKLRCESGLEERTRRPSPARPRVCVRTTLLRSGQPLRLQVMESGECAVEVFNALGQRTRRVHGGLLTPGTHAFDLGQIPAGVYQLRITTSGTAVSQRTVVIE